MEFSEMSVTFIMVIQQSYSMTKIREEKKHIFLMLSDFCLNNSKIKNPIISE